MVLPPSRHQARAARTTKRTAPMFRVCRAAEAPISRAAPRAAAMAAAMVNPLKRLRIGGDRLYIRVPAEFPLSSPDVCEILLLQQTD